ncbi:hypothetical protein HAX54_041945 [Datura stramonium]|uniref:Uncharacterized protein n=1 Tax=Datura stramonium TaxID=4076 RepID=A0ABS8SM16_DATST|nr:hypothetical protein [Datura stramonium]
MCNTVWLKGLLGDARMEGYMAVIKSTWQLDHVFSCSNVYASCLHLVGIEKKSLSQQMFLNIQPSVAGKWEPFMIASLLMIYIYTHLRDRLYRLWSMVHPVCSG